MFIQKTDHKHELVPDTKRTRVTIGGTDIPYMFKILRCTGKGCTYRVTTDMVPVDPDVRRLVGIGDNPIVPKRTRKFVRR